MQCDPTDDLESLRAAFSGRLLTDAADVAPFLVDWRKTWRGVAIAVAQPDTVADVAAIVRWCAANDVAIVPQGGNTGQSGGSVPRDAGRNLLLSLTRLNTIRAIDTANDTITVDAGCILQSAQDAAAQVDRLFPLSLGAEGSCTIGGNLATNAGGTAVLRYGNARDLCLGLEVVTANGEIWEGLKGLRKDNSGYDLRDLFIGSEGTLGIITGAVMKLFPKPAGCATAFVAVDGVDQAMALFAELRARHYTVLTAFELMSDICLNLVLDHIPTARNPSASATPWYALIEFSDAVSESGAKDALESALTAALEATLIRDATVAASLAQSQALWHLREAISESQGASGRAIKHDVAVPIARITAFVAAALAQTADEIPDATPVIFGHLGDGNLHFNFSLPRDADDAHFACVQAKLNRVVHDLVRAHDGTISAEHGLGVLRRDEAHAHRSPVEQRLMRTIKDALDPKGIMNPGKLIPSGNTDSLVTPTGIEPVFQP
jgi:FAD/FMN-containing dehydrogenase